MKDRQITNPQVAAVFNNYPENMRKKLMFLRELIFDTAAATEGVGKLEETLKWGEPSYLTPKCFPQVFKRFEFARIPRFQS